MPDLAAVPVPATPSLPPLPPGARFADPENDDYALLFDLHGEQLPSGKSAKVVPYRGAAERALLASLKAEGPATVDHLVRFLLGTVEQIDGAPASEAELLDLADPDVRAILLRSRYVTHGAVTELSWDCAPPAVPKGGGCGHRGSGPNTPDGVPPNTHAVDLERLSFLPLVELKPIVLPRSKKTAAWFPNTLRRQKQYLARRRPSVDGLDLQALLFARGVQLDGKPITSAMADDLEAGDHSALRKEIPRWGGADSRVEAECNGCRYLLRTLAERIPGFFFPELGGE